MKALAAAAVVLLLGVGCEAESQSQQIGDNGGGAVQATAGGSGDSVAGSQVTGVVGNGVAQLLLSATDVEATSGNAEMSNFLDVELGAVAEADAADDSLDDVEDAFAQAQQHGDNWLWADQSASAWTGDAVSGAQITGIVSDDGFTVQNSWAASDTTAESGDVTATNSATAQLGPRASAQAFGSDANAKSQQIGSNRGQVRQSADGSSGAANSGSQVAGAQGSGTSQGSGSASGSGSTSGDAEGSNSSDFSSGPSSRSGS